MSDRTCAGCSLVLDDLAFEVILSGRNAILNDTCIDCCRRAWGRMLGELEGNAYHVALVALKRRLAAVEAA